MTCDQGSQCSEADSKLKNDNGKLNKTNLANIASQSSVPQHVFMAYGNSATHSYHEMLSSNMDPSIRSTKLLLTTEADFCSQRESEVKTQQDERLAPKKLDGVFEIKNSAGNVGATSNQRHP